MQQLEVFFDYSCPYCLIGHEHLVDLVSGYPGIEMVWRPCEAHPRPEPGLHSDRCIQALFFALEHGVEPWEFHKRMYELAIHNHSHIDNIDAIVGCVEDILDGKALHKALESGQYVDVQLESNRYAFEQSGVWAVPSYRMDGRKLDAVEGVGVHKQQLADFMDSAK